MRRDCLAVLCFAAIYVVKPVSARDAVYHPQVVSFLQEAVTGKWHNAKSQGIAAFLCSTDTSTFLRSILSKSSPVRISTRNWQRALSKIATRKETITYIVNLMCPEVEELLQEAGKQRLLKIPNRWLLLNITEPQDLTANAITLPQNGLEGTACREKASFLVQSYPGFKGTTATDSDVTLVCGEAESTITLVDMWSTETPLGFWWPTKGFYGDRRPPSVRRITTGLNGRELRVAVLVTRNDTLEHMDDGKDIQYDVVSKFNWEVINNLVKMLNASLAIRVTNAFGYKINGTWNGAVGLLVRGEAEMTGTSIAPAHSRLSVIKYTNFPMPVDGAFIFRAPPMSYEHNLFTQPFPKSLWFATIGIILLCAILLYGTLKIEELAGIQEDDSKALASGITHHLISEGRKRQLDASWDDVALLAFGAICQQGSPVEARGLTGRIITLFLFIGIVFLYTSYSASIVALLQSTSTSTRTYKDLLRTKMTLGAENQDYNVYYMKNLDDPIRKKIYETKIKNNFMSVEEGVRRLRTSYFAFHTMRTLIYKEIAETFKENEKCGLVEIGNFLSLVQDPMIIVSNWSENTELIMISLRKNHERGIRHRQIQRFLTPKPQCVNQGGNFQSVALIDTEAAFVVLGLGYGLGLLFLIIETFLFRYQRYLHTLYARA